METKELLLSICIPTYNRASILVQTLENITSDPDFDDEVEVIISDNASTDHTAEAVKPFLTHPNIHYYRNEENVIDHNFSIALSHGNGAYLKLQNDYIQFAEGMIGLMKRHIREYRQQKPPLFFFKRVRKEVRNQPVIKCNSLDDFIYAVSYNATWISNYGCWKEQFEELKEKDRFFSKSLMQVDWSYRIIDKYQQAIVIPQDLFKPIDTQKLSKGGYNYFGVFVRNYFDIMRLFVEEGKVSKKSYKKDKKNTLVRFRERFVKYLVFPKQQNSFDTGSTLEILWNYYHEFPLFYLVIIAIGFAFLLKGISWPVRKIRSVFKKRSL